MLVMPVIGRAEEQQTGLVWMLRTGRAASASAGAWRSIRGAALRLNARYPRHASMSIRRIDIANRHG